MYLSIIIIGIHVCIVIRSLFYCSSLSVLFFLFHLSLYDRHLFLHPLVPLLLLLLPLLLLPGLCVFNCFEPYTRLSSLFFLFFNKNRAPPFTQMLLFCLFFSHSCSLSTGPSYPLQVFFYAQFPGRCSDVNTKQECLLKEDVGSFMRYAVVFFLFASWWWHLRLRNRMGGSSSDILLTRYHSLPLLSLSFCLSNLFFTIPHYFHFPTHSIAN